MLNCSHISMSRCHQGIRWRLQTERSPVHQKVRQDGKKRSEIPVSAEEAAHSSSQVHDDDRQGSRRASVVLHHQSAEVAEDHRHSEGCSEGSREECPSGRGKEEEARTEDISNLGTGAKTTTTREEVAAANRKARCEAKSSTSCAKADTETF